MTDRPKDVGILALEASNTPSQFTFRNVFVSHSGGDFVSQSELEKHDEVSTGKYTAGLLQQEMSCTDDREDIHSFLLTVTQSLLRKFDIDPACIGRLDVGTETLIDKSKSVKTVLMQLFGSNSDIEGIDSKNACYGGTAALFNALAWVQSEAWDGRYALVVAGDIAVYAAGPIRPVGGAGAIAMLIGPDAPIAFESQNQYVRASHMAHAYDFYKADLSTEYPIVDGPLTLTCYLDALDRCYQGYKRKIMRKPLQNGMKVEDPPCENKSPHVVTLKTFDYMLYHSPYGKLVQRAYARLLYNDYLDDPDDPAFSEVPLEWRNFPRQETFLNKEIERYFCSLSKQAYDASVMPSMLVSRRCGNTYSASLYCALASLICQEPAEKLLGKRVGLFSYGSGLASSFFVANIVGDVSKIARNLNLVTRLDARYVVSPTQYVEMLGLRASNHNKSSYEPSGLLSKIWPRAYYLDRVDDKYRRFYAVTETEVDT